MGLFKKLRGTSIGPIEAADQVRRGRAVLLDVREVFEFEAGHAPGARHLPLSLLGERLASLETDQPVIVVCRSGHRSARATAVLVATGLDAMNLEGGMQAWAGADLPVRTPDGRPGTVA